MVSIISNLWFPAEGHQVAAGSNNAVSPGPRGPRYRKEWEEEVKSRDGERAGRVR